MKQLILIQNQIFTHLVEQMVIYISIKMKGKVNCRLLKVIKRQSLVFSFLAKANSFYQEVKIIK
jgi:hypothetical protein